MPGKQIIMEYGGILPKCEIVEKSTNFGIGQFHDRKVSWLTASSTGHLCNKDSFSRDKLYAMGASPDESSGVIRALVGKNRNICELEI